jgi:hypothetical protein
MTAKDYLCQIPALRNRIAAQCSLVDDYLDEACRATSRLTAVNYGGTDRHSRVETYACKRADMMSDINDMNRSLWQMEQDVLRVTAAMPGGANGRWSRLLVMRYRAQMPWKDIATMLGVEIRQAYNLHGHALRAYQRTHNQLGMYPILENKVLTLHS